MTRVVKDIINFNKTNFNTTAETETLCVHFLLHVARFQQIDFCAQFLAARKIFDWFFMIIITILDPKPNRFFFGYHNFSVPKNKTNQANYTNIFFVLSSQGINLCSVKLKTLLSQSMCIVIY